MQRTRYPAFAKTATQPVFTQFVSTLDAKSWMSRSEPFRPASGIEECDIDAVADEVVHAAAAHLLEGVFMSPTIINAAEDMVRPNISRCRGRSMAGAVIPHFANDVGAEQIFVGVKEFNCMGARPPFEPGAFSLIWVRTIKSSALLLDALTSTIRVSKPPKAIQRTAS